MVAEPSRVVWGWTAPARALLAVLAIAGAAGLYSTAPGEATGPTDGPRLVVDPNTVPAQVLGALPKVGPALAGGIVAARRTAAFRSIDDLDERVRGIGPATIAALRPHLQLRVVSSGGSPTGPGR